MQNIDLNGRGRTTEHVLRCQQRLWSPLVVSLNSLITPVF